MVGEKIFVQIYLPDFGMHERQIDTIYGQDNHYLLLVHENGKPDVACSCWEAAGGYRYVSTHDLLEILSLYRELSLRG